MMMALAGCARPAGACSCRAASRCRRAAARTPARCRRSARASRTALVTLEEAAELGCRACGSPGGGCQFLGTAATSQVVGEALGLSLPHSALAPVGSADLARHGARAVGPRAAWRSRTRGLTVARRPDRRARCATRWSCTRRSAARRTCCCTCRRSRTRRACAGRRSTTGPRVNREVPRLVERAAERPRAPPDGARVPRRRRARGDAAPAAARPARPRLPHRARPAARRRARRVGDARERRAPVPASCSASATASIPTT